MRVFSALRGSHRWFEANTDAFADGELRGSELARFESHLADCERCGAAVRQAQGMKSLVAALPELAVIRSFAITESMLNQPAPAALARNRGWAVPLRAVQGFGAAAVALFAVLVIVDVGAGGSGSLASPDGDFDAEAPLRDGLSNSTAEIVPAADAEDDPQDGDPNGEDGGAEPTAGSVEGAGVDPPPPLPTPVPGGDDDDDAAPAATSTADRTFTQSIADSEKNGALAPALAADGDGGADWLRLAQVTAGAGALLAGIAYFGLRRSRQS